MSKRERDVQNDIRVALSQYGVVLRLNSGKAYGGVRVWDSRRNEYVLTQLRTVALCPKGTADLVFFGEDGTTAFIECKDHKGKASEDQKRFLAMMAQYGFKTGTARSVEDALNIIGRKKYEEDNKGRVGSISEET